MADQLPGNDEGVPPALQSKAPQPKKRRILDYEAPPIMPRFLRLFRLFGAISCICGMIIGLVITWYGANGVWYAIMEAPTRDIKNDLFGASLATILGVIVVVFSARWLHGLLRSVGGN